MNHHWYDDPIAALDSSMLAAARKRQSQLTKPPGSLGRLEELGMTLAAMQGTQQPRMDHVWISVFAGDHGVTAEGVSAFPQVVTAEMVRNFARGGAAISVLAQEWKARLEVINVGTVQPLEELPGVLDARVGSGTANFIHGSAMTGSELQD
ncbi:MAG: nicotinate-nucleotide--dimethylbenzimidazole phosphoribosyltransferase, partial [Devosia sp.]|nr:nicotinate-nucleotide--dimethylbenzimidazole phosphoribosyltransferase [Devosia sp.]